jgi:hypothetical protein
MQSGRGPWSRLPVRASAPRPAGRGLHSHLRAVVAHAGRFLLPGRAEGGRPSARSVRYAGPARKIASALPRHDLERGRSHERQQLVALERFAPH